jgi:hypothetical protein
MDWGCLRTEGWGRLHNEELHNLYASPDIIWVIMSRLMRWAGNVARVENINVFHTLVGRPEGKRPLRTVVFNRGYAQTS